MKRILLFCLAFCCGVCSKALSLENSNLESKRKTICLNMIVKNEKDVIASCLASVIPIIDSWVIVDTGSTDGTQFEIERIMKGIPGNLYERPWVNFGHNRNEALSLAREKADYILFIDADDKLSFSKTFQLPDLTEDFYTIVSNNGQQQSELPCIIKSSIDWRWQGAIQESIAASTLTTGMTLAGVEYAYINNGAQAKESLILVKNLARLQKEQESSTSVFYTIPVLLQLHRLDEALIACEKRIGMGGFEEEVFAAHFMKGRILEVLKKDSNLIKENLAKAFSMRPHRLEPIYYLTQRLWFEESYEEGYDLLLSALTLPKHQTDTLFIEPWIADYGLLMQYALFAAKTRHYVEGLKSLEKLFEYKNLPETERVRANECKAYIQTHLEKETQEKLRSILFK